MGLFSFESKQVKEWKKLAKSGDMEAQYHLARAYANGKGASINMKRAVDYYSLQNRNMRRHRHSWHIFMVMEKV